MATFKARARALDMLGRQQIAGIPTATSELFKNAHDAYATRVEVDFFRNERMFVLRDDGIGMTEDDFLQRWLTLGTESKLQEAGKLALPHRPVGYELRTMTGEKGIGRLAIAAIGPLVLVLTRAKRGDVLNDLVMAFIAWPLYECPGIDLHEIQIPVKSFPGGIIPGKDDVLALVGETKRNLLDLQSRIDPVRAARLLKQLESFDVDPRRLNAGLADGPTLLNDGHGTQFFVRPADETLLAELDEAGANEYAPALIKHLSGFTNTMTPNASEPKITTAFRDRQRSDLVVDIIEHGSFFTPADFKSADHVFAGSFDEYGNFKGSVQVFDKQVAYELPSTLGTREKLQCGPFSIEFACMQAVPSESLSYHRDPEAYALLFRKLDRLGGLYIYRDGIRVLPYGDKTHDFLAIEERRSKKADYYFFSYRRMFGAILLTREKNGKLHEKAGREGFRQDKAFKDLQKLLSNFLIQLAAEFFRKEGPQVDIYNKRREELSSNEVIRRDHEAFARKQRDTFEKNLDVMFEKINADEPKRDVDKFVDSLQQQLRATRPTGDAGAFEAVLLSIDTQARKQLEDIRKRYRLPKPRGLALTPKLQRELDEYSAQWEALEQGVFAPARERIDIMMAKVTQDGRIDIDRRKQIEQSLSREVKRARLELGQAVEETQKAAQGLHDQARSAIRDASSIVETEIASLLAHIAKLEVSSLDEAQIAVERKRMESSIQEASEHARDVLAKLREVMYATTTGLGAKGTTPVELAEALEEEVLTLREKADADLALLQLGMAIEVINHEFAVSIRAVRIALKRFKGWADANPKLQDVYRDIRESFEHLDGYLTLFTPLQRRLYRQAIEFHGADIANYVGDLFKERLERDSIALDVTDKFRQHAINSFPSTFYPVFVNLIDNALFWLKGRPEPRFVRLDVDGPAMVVTDSGPGISKRDRDAIFELGFTRKPGGRGLGLHVSREVLKKVDYSLTLADPEPGKGASFRIEPRGRGTSESGK